MVVSRLKQWQVHITAFSLLLVVYFCSCLSSVGLRDFFSAECSCPPVFLWNTLGKYHLCYASHGPEMTRRSRCLCCSTLIRPSSFYQLNVAVNFKLLSPLKCHPSVSVNKKAKFFTPQPPWQLFPVFSEKFSYPSSPSLTPLISLSLSLFDRRPIQECAPTFTIGTLWLAHRQNTAGCGHISSVRTHRRTWMAGSGPWTRLRWCSRVTL